MTEIYLAENHLLLEAGYGKPEMRSHSACHVLISLYGDMRVIMDKEDVICCGAVLPSGTAHIVDNFGEPFLVFLFDITSSVAGQIRYFAVLEEQAAEDIACSYQMLTDGNPEEVYENFFMEVMGIPGICGVGSRITDERIITDMYFQLNRVVI